MRNNLIEKAKKVLLGNKKKGFTLPTNSKLYPAQWKWDSGFIALGYSHFNLKYALDEISTLLKGQWKDGMIPHILFHDLNTNYYPNHSVWNCGNKIHSSGITQPPVLAVILKKILDKNKVTDKEKIKIKSIVKKLKKYHVWLIKYRDPKNTGLVSILHPWESGYDNSPLWDYSMSEVKIEKNLKYKRGDNKIINPEYRPLDEDYDRYVSIKNHLKKNKYNPKNLYNKSMFNVVDVGFNSIFLRANKDLLLLLKKFKLQHNELEKFILRSERQIEKLYNEKKGVFTNYDIKNKKKIIVPSITNYFILFADLKNQSINKKIIKKLKKHNQNKKYLFSSIKPNYRKFEEKRYWRGPVWINCNWIIYQGVKNKDIKFANIIKNKTINLIKKNGFYEYYSFKTGKAFGANNFSWTASLFLDLIFEKRYN
ncbi:trehalase family glycosidase [Candidatus Pelagibacter sp.]|nr:trehalase family glycosidase [Candidatus Pelagibacter sp.]